MWGYPYLYYNRLTLKATPNKLDFFCVSYQQFTMYHYLSKYLRQRNSFGRVTNLYLGKDTLMIALGSVYDQAIYSVFLRIKNSLLSVKAEIHSIPQEIDYVRAYVLLTAIRSTQ